jgi:hypothetical protein
MADIYLFDHKGAGELLEVPELPDEWRAWALEKR